MIKLDCGFHFFLGWARRCRQGKSIEKGKHIVVIIIFVLKHLDEIVGIVVLLEKVFISEDAAILQEIKCGFEGHVNSKIHLYLHSYFGYKIYIVIISCFLYLTLFLLQVTIKKDVIIAVDFAGLVFYHLFHHWLTFLWFIFGNVLEV